VTLNPVHRGCTKYRIELVQNAPILYVWRSEAQLSKLGLVNAVGKFEAEKNIFGIARFPCGSTAFLSY